VRMMDRGVNGSITPGDCMEMMDRANPSSRSLSGKPSSGYLDGVSLHGGPPSGLTLNCQALHRPLP
jgi:hypothetical protein